MFCKYCGRQIADDSKFCEYCGELVQKRAEVSDDTRLRAETLGAPIETEAADFVPTPVPKPSSEPTRVVPMPEPAPAPAPEPVPEPEPMEAPVKKPLSKGLLWGLIGGGVGVVALLTLILWLCLRTPVVPVDVTQFLDFKVSGYDGYGVGECKLDFDGLERAALGAYPAGNDAKSRKKQIEYKEKAAILRGAVTLEFEKRTHLKVGDELTAEVKLDKSVEKELNIEFSTATKKTYTVTEKDLGGGTEVDVLKEFFTVRIEGYSGSATARVEPLERGEEFVFTTHDGTEYTAEGAVENATGTPYLKLLCSDGTTERVTLESSLSLREKIKNGDEVVLTLAPSAKSTLMQYGLSVSVDTLSVKAEKLETLIAAPDELEVETLDDWTLQYAGELEKYLLANWDKLLHGGNILATDTKTVENMLCESSIVGVDDKGKNALLLIYSADIADEAIMLDNGAPKKYYFGVRIENLLLDAEGKLKEKDIKLPSDKNGGFIAAYADYDELHKELTRDWSTLSE